MIFKEYEKTAIVAEERAFRITRPHLFLTPARPRLLGGIRQALQSAQKEGCRGLIALFLGALPSQMRRSRVSGILELGLGGAFQVCLALYECAKKMKTINIFLFLITFACFLFPQTAEELSNWVSARQKRTFSESTNIGAYIFANSYSGTSQYPPFTPYFGIYQTNRGFVDTVFELKFNRFYQISITSDNMLLILLEVDGTGHYKQVLFFTFINKDIQVRRLIGMQEFLTKEAIYRGKDSLWYSNGLLFWHFPLYKPTDPNCCPTGGVSKLHQFSIKNDSLIEKIPSSRK